MSPNNTPASYHQYLEGGGEMGQLIRSFDWSATSLGTPDKWSQSLLTTLSIILNSRFPMFLWWGDDLVQFYNDAYTPSLRNTDKHPKALGQKGEECWPETWSVVKPLIDEVLSGGEAFWSEDHLVPIYRNNHLEDAYWTFGYGKVNDETGKIAGVLVTSYETTEKVQAFNDLKKADARFRSMIEQSPVAMLVNKGEDLTFEIINPAMLQLIDRDISVIGKPLYEVLPELLGQPILDRLYHTYRTGEEWTGHEQPINVRRRGKAELGYYNLSYKPLIENGRIAGVLQSAVDVTEQVIARKKLEISEQRLNSMVMNTPMGMAILHGRELRIDVVNQPVLDIWSRTREEAQGKKLLELFPELIDQPFPQLLEDVFDMGKPISMREIEVHKVTAEGDKHYCVDFTYFPLFDNNGAVTEIMVSVVNTTEIVNARKLLEKSEADQVMLNRILLLTNSDLEKANAELVVANKELSDIQQDLYSMIVMLTESEAKVNRVQKAPVAICILNGRDLIIESANDMMLKFWSKPAAIIGKPLTNALPELKGQPFFKLLDDVFTTGEVYHGKEEKAIIERNGKLEEGFYSYIYQPLKDENGKTTTIMIVATDVTGQVLSRKSRIQ